MSSSPIEQIKQRLDIVDVIGSYLKLHKAGANFKALCPFHSEKEPSFYVSPSREIWHCFGCGRGGDMIEFVKEIEGVEFIEALKILADKAGVILKFQDPKYKNEKIKVLEILEKATLFYQRELYRNKKVLDYLFKRGLKLETIKNFKLGFSPFEENGWNNLFRFLKNRGFKEKEIEKSGLVIKSKKGWYDRFRQRIMFPLFDSSGRIVGFSGRAFELKREDVGKYINTPQTIVYDKSRLLYGFDKAKTEIRKKGYCVLVEGQMDVIMSHQAGITNSVAISGTALTNYHLNNIKRLANRLVMAFDNDEAGILASQRSIEMALRSDFEIEIAVLETEMDPADVILKNPERWKEAVEKPVHIIDFYLNVLKEKNPELRNFRNAVKEKVFPLLSLISSEIEKNHWLKEIAKRLDLKEESIWKDFKNSERVIKQRKNFFELNNEPIYEEKIKKTRREVLEERIMGIILWQRKKLLTEEQISLLSAKNQMILKKKGALNDYYKNLAFEAEICYSGIEDIKKELFLLFKELKKEILKEKLAVLGNEISKLERESNNFEIEKKLLDFQKISQELSELT